jgi:hypothetical protein
VFVFVCELRINVQMLRPILPIMCSCIGPILLLVMAVAVVGAEESADNSALVVDDGKDNFLILNADEVKANAQLLSLLSSASKEEVEELVDSNPRYRETILNRIRGAAEQKRYNKHRGEMKAPGNETVAVTKEVESSASSAAVPPPPPAPLGMPQEKPAVDLADDNNDDDDAHVIDRLKSASSQAGALKIFKIGAGIKAKLAAIVKKSKLKGMKKGNKSGTAAGGWPGFHYQVSTLAG